MFDNVILHRREPHIKMRERERGIWHKAYIPTNTIINAEHKSDDRESGVFLFYLRERERDMRMVLVTRGTLHPTSNRHIKFCTLLSYKIHFLPLHYLHIFLLLFYLSWTLNITRWAQFLYFTLNFPTHSFHFI